MLDKIAILVPAFIDSQEEFWFSENGERLFKDFCLMLNETGAPVSVVSDSENFVKIGVETGFEGLVHKDTSQNTTPIQTALLVHSRPAFQGHDLLVVDFRYPSIGLNVLKEALKAFRNCRKSALISISKQKDHPCQMDVGYRKLDIGTIHLLDDDRCYPLQGKKLLVSKPFYYDWTHEGILEPGIYEKQSDLLGDWLVPSEVKALRTQQVLWINDSENSARLLFQLEYQNQIAFVRTGGLTPVMMHLTRDMHGKNILRVSVNGSQQISDRLKLIMIPFDGNGSICGPTDYWWPFHVNERINVEADGHISGWAYMLAEETQDGLCDFIEPFCPAEAPWSVTDNHKIILKQTGRIIQGRQDYPEVYAADMAIMILSRHRKALSNKILKDPVLFPLDKNTAFPVHNRVDYMRYKNKQA